MRNIVAARTVGHRMVRGEKVPVVDQIVRERRPGLQPVWIVLWWLCQGSFEREAEFETRAEAIAAFENSSPQTP